MSIKKDLQSLIRGKIFDGRAVLDYYSRDASLFQVRPQVVVFPKDVRDIKTLINFVSESAKNLSIVPRGGGSDMTGGPLGESIVLDLTRHLNRIKKIGKDYAVVEPGAFYRDFEKATLKKNLIMPSYPASKDLCAVGGMVANNAGGEKTLAYGKTIDYVRALRVVLRDGNEYEIKPLNKNELEQKLGRSNFESNIYRRVFDLINGNYEKIKAAKPKVSKNSAGYCLWDVWDGQTFDLTKLFVGSQGTLGIITEITFRLIRPKPHSKLLIIFLKDSDVKHLGRLVNEVLRYKPESFEVFDDNSLKLAMRYLFFRFAWQFFPELGLVLSGGMPKLVLLAEFSGDKMGVVEEAVRAAQTAIAAFGVKSRISTSERDKQKYFTVRRESFNLLRSKIKDKSTAPFIDDIIIRPESLPQFLPRLEKILSQYNLLYTLAGHIGDGNFHIIPLMNLADPQTKEIIKGLGKKVYDLVKEFDGSTTAEHNDGLIRGHLLKDMYGAEVYKLFEQVKNIFDPDNIFNPGKKVGANWRFALDHLRKK